MTYEALRIDDFQMLDVLEVARREQAMVMVHAENHDVIRWFSRRLLERGHRLPRYHAVSHPRIAEGEATSRAIDLAALIDVPLLIVHVSAREAIDAIRDARRRGLRIFGETCPQYLFLTAKDLDREGMVGAMYCCSPPPRDEAAQEAVWSGLEDGTFEVFSSDHAPYRFDASGKLAKGPNASFKDIANGVPGIEVRLALLFSEGVGKGRIDINRFVALTATNAARLYGLYPRKGSITVGADADIAIWNPEKEVTIGTKMLQRQRRLHPLRRTSRARLAGDGAEPRAGRGRRRRPPGRARQRRVPAMRAAGASAAPGADRPRARPGTKLGCRPAWPRNTRSENEMTRHLRTAAAQLWPRSPGRRSRIGGEAAGGDAARGARRGLPAGGVPRARAHHLLSALLVGRCGGGGPLLRTRNARTADPAPLRRGEAARSGLLPRLRGALRGRGAAPSLQHRDPGRLRRKHRGQVPQGAPARPRRPPPRAGLPASREALLRGRQPRLPRYGACSDG